MNVQTKSLLLLSCTSLVMQESRAVISSFELSFLDQNNDPRHHRNPSSLLFSARRQNQAPSYLRRIRILYRFLKLCLIPSRTSIIAQDVLFIHSKHGVRLCACSFIQKNLEWVARTVKTSISFSMEIVKKRYRCH